MNPHGPAEGIGAPWDQMAKFAHAAKPRRRWTHRLAAAAVGAILIGIAGFVLPPQTSGAAPSETLPCQNLTSPIIITEATTLSDQHLCSSDRDPVLVIATTEPVVLDNVALEGHHNLITTTARIDLTVRNSWAKGLWTTTDCSNFGRIVYADTGVNRLIFEHNEWSRTAGVKIIGESNTGSVKLRWNRASNIYGDSTNACGGGAMQFAQLADVKGADIEIAWNEVINLPDQSRVEDVISTFGDTGGMSPAAPLRIHDNYLQGAYPIPAATGGFSGGGIMVGDQYGATGGSRFYLVENNQVVGTTNYGINVVCADDAVVRNNRVVAANRLADGRWIEAANVGLSLTGPVPWNDGCVSHRNQMTDNVVGWQRGPNSGWGYGRADYWAPAAGSEGNVFSYSPLKEGEVTLADEQAEYQRWMTKSASQGLGRNGSVMSTTTTTTTITTTTTTTTTPSTTAAPPTSTTAAPTTTTTATPTTSTTAAPTTTSTAPPTTTTTLPPAPTGPRADLEERLARLREYLAWLSTQSQLP